MKTIKKAQTGVKQKPATEKPKIAPKKPKTVSQRIGDTTLRDIKNASEDGLQLATLGVYGKVKKALGGEYKYKKIGEKKYGGKVTKAKNGKSFPDLNKDGKITKADILKGRGVIAKKGAVVKKYQMGGFVSNEFAAKSISKPKTKSKPKFIDSPIKTVKSKNINAFQGKKGMLAKSGVSMKKCKYGCK